MLSTFNTLALLTPPEAAEFLSVIPAAMVTIVVVAFILIDMFHRQGTPRDYLAYFSVIGLAATAAGCWYLWDTAADPEVFAYGPAFFGMLYFDQFALFFAALACISGALAMLCSPALLQSHRMDRGEYYLLILFSVIGMIVMTSAADLLTLFIALELMSIPIYVVAGFLRKDSRGAEASMKYFILGSISAALMLYGIALIYGAAGTTNLEMISQNLIYITDSGHEAYPMVILGMVLIMSGFIFKVAGVPFHIWAPDVYSGSPTPAVGFMATAFKAIAFAAMLRVMVVAFPAEVFRGGFFGLGWIDVAFFVAFASMVLGNFVAVVQKSVKRMLAYSSIAHAGYIMVGFVAANSHPDFYLHNDAILFYAVAYVFAVVGAFGVLSYFGRRGRAVETFDDLGELGLKYPFMGLVMGIFMFSAAGFPPTAGFLGKFYIFRSGVDVYAQSGETAMLVLVIVGVLTSVVGAYYYLKVLVYMYMKPAKKEFPPLEHKGTRWAVAICAAATLYIGMFPAQTIDISRDAVMDMSGVPTGAPEGAEIGGPHDVDIQAVIRAGEVRLEELVPDEDE